MDADMKDIPDELIGPTNVKDGRDSPSLIIKITKRAKTKYSANIKPYFLTAYLSSIHAFGPLPVPNLSALTA